MSFGIPVRNGLGVGLLASTSLSTRGGSFSPASLFLAGEQGFIYDPSDFTTLYQDNAGTTPVTAVGQTVGLVRDKSGRGNHATQSVLASRPILQQDANGKFYLLFDGSDDFLVTNTITPGTDKAQVFAGVRKLSDAAAGVLVESSVNAGLNNGTFFLLTPLDATGVYGWRSRGTINAGANGSGFSAPVTNILTGLGDISGDSSILRVNGNQVSINATDQGTGNYLTYTHYIGRRGGTTLPFNGRLYSLIVRFGANLSAAQISQTEAWVNSRTGAY